MRTIKRKRRSASFVTVDATDPAGNLKALVATAQQWLPGLGVTNAWEHSSWSLSPTLFALLGRHTRNVTLNFLMPPALGAEALRDDWADVAKVLFVAREREKHKVITSHRSFISVIGYIAEAANHRKLAQLTPAILDEACNRIADDTKGSQTYKMHNMVAEFARRCSQRGLCRVDLKGYRYHGVSRPNQHGGLSGRKLDDVSLITESSPRVLAEHTFQALGELFRNVPRDHKYRVYLLVITLLVCLGRRRSEITLLPRQKLQQTPTGVFFSYLKLKAADGSQQHTLARVPVMTEVVSLVEAVLQELEGCSGDLYACAEEMCRSQGPDLRFLDDFEEDDCLTYIQLLDMGLPSSVFESGGWFHKNGLIKRALTDSMRVGVKKSGYVHKSDVERYCWSHYHPQMTEVIYVANGKDYYIKDMLLVKFTGTSSGHYTRWVVETCSSTMFDKFLPQLERLSEEYASSRLSQKFTSHDFRHTMNDALDKGGLPEVMQTEFFGRKNPRDNKAYQHTSPEQKALELREKIKLGEVGGAVADRAMRLPVEKREVYIVNKVRAVHDLGIGMCLRRWQDGPCDRHLQCDTGCGLLAWLKNPEDKESEFEEIMRQLAQHLFSLETAVGIFSNLEGLTISNWEKQLCIKISNLLDRAEDLVPGTDLRSVYDYINTGAFDGVATREFVDGVGKGYELYVQRREKFHKQCLDYEREFSEMFETPRVIIPFVEVKGG